MRVWLYAGILSLASTIATAADTPTGLNPSALQALLSQMHTTSLHLKQRGYCGDNTTCFDVAVDSTPKGLDSCWIEVLNSKHSHASEYCVVFRGSSRAAADQAWARSTQVVRRELPSWSYSNPKLPSSSYLTQLTAVDPADANHEVHLSYMLINGQYRIAILVRVTDAKVM